MPEERQFTADKNFYDALMSKGTSLATDATPEQMAYLAKARKMMQESTPNRIYEDGLLTTPLHANANPFLYCRMRRYGRGGSYGAYSRTSEQGHLYNNTTNAAKLFKNFIGGQDSDYDNYSIPPMIQFVGPDARWLKSDGWLEYAGSTNQYSYGTYEMVLMFLKNTGTTDLTRTFYRYLSCSTQNASYNYSSAYVGTPDALNANSGDITSITWVAVHNYATNTSGTSASFSITIPAGKTVALLFYSTPRYYTSTYTHYSFFSTIGIYSLSSFLVNELIVDHERTQKALQLKTQNIYEIWR
jgi:hypothetical protein